MGIRNYKLEIRNFILSLILFFIAVSNSSSAYNPPQKYTRILFILDASGTMAYQWETDTRINIAKKVLSGMVDSLSHDPNVQMALRVYGFRYPNDDRNCKDSFLEVPFADDNAVKIKTFIKTIKPLGTTPIAYSLEQSANDFPNDDMSERNVIILITDGEESCGGDPCKVSQALQSKGIIVRPFIVGVGLVNIKNPLDCAGQYFDVQTQDQFYETMDYIVSYMLNPTTAQVNLLDRKGNATETDVEMTFYDQATGQIKYNFTHSLNNRGVADTIYTLDPQSTYRLAVHTIPALVKENITLTPGRHNIIAVDAVQGFLDFRMEGVTNYPYLKAILKDKQTNETFYVQDASEKVKYLAGRYRVEILTLPRIVKDIKIGADSTTTIEITQPGVLTINGKIQGPCSIFQFVNGKQELIYRVPTFPGTIPMQPGDYLLMYKSALSKGVIYTQKYNFTIKSAVGTSIKLN